MKIILKAGTAQGENIPDIITATVETDGKFLSIPTLIKILESFILGAPEKYKLDYSDILIESIK